MRVLMLNRPDAFTVPGGDTVQMVETARALERLGVNVRVGTTADELPAENFDLIHIFNWEQVTPLLNRESANPLTRLPVVLTPIFMNYTGHWYEEAADNIATWKIIAKVLGRNGGRRLYKSWQEQKFRKRKGSDLAKCLNCVSRVIAGHRLEVSELCSASGLSWNLRERCTVVPNGVDGSLYGPKPEPTLPIPPGYVLQVARIQAAKNQLGLLRALYNVPVPVVLAGQPSPYEPEYVMQCHSLAASRGNVYFTNSRPPQEMPGVYAGAAVHVLPSFVECLPLVNFEAAAAGCRVVSTSVGGTEEYFGCEAWYCDPWNPLAIRSAVLKALASPVPHQLRRRVLEQYSWDVVAAKVIAIYEELARANADGRGAPARLAHRPLGPSTRKVAIGT